MGGNTVGIQHKFDLLDRTRSFGLKTDCGDIRATIGHPDSSHFCGCCISERSVWSEYASSECDSALHQYDRYANFECHNARFKVWNQSE